jgi:hypothetical protein
VPDFITFEAGPRIDEPVTDAAAAGFCGGVILEFDPDKEVHPIDNPASMIPSEVGPIGQGEAKCIIGVHGGAACTKSTKKASTNGFGFAGVDCLCAFGGVGWGNDGWFFYGGFERGFGPVRVGAGWFSPPVPNPFKWGLDHPNPHEPKY